VCQTIRELFRDRVATPQGLNTFYDNAPIPSHVKGTTWCRFTVHFGEPYMRTCGTLEYAVRGQGIAQLFVPTNIGDGATLALADAVVAAFRDLRLVELAFGIPGVIRVGQYDDEYQVNVVCPFEVENII